MNTFQLKDENNKLEGLKETLGLTFELSSILHSAQPFQHSKQKNQLSSAKGHRGGKMHKFYFSNRVHDFLSKVIQGSEQHNKLYPTRKI